MITKITLHNWKSFKEASLYIDPLTVLIGLNASGKSNVVDALRFLQRSVSMPLTTAISGTGGDAQISEIRGGIDWVALHGNKEFRIDITAVYQSNDVRDELNYEVAISLPTNGSSRKAFLLNEKLSSVKISQNNRRECQHFWTEPVNENNEEIILDSMNNHGRPGNKVRVSRQNSVLFQSSTLRFPQNDSRFFINFLKEVIKKIYILDSAPSHMRDYCRLSDTLLPDGSNVAGVIAALPDAEKAKIEAALTKYVGQLPDNPFSKIYVELVGKFGQDAMLYGTEVLPDGDKIDIDARSMSDGTLRAIALLTAILTREKGSLLVIEEVDNGLHPSKAGLLLSFMLELGKKQGVDILITTHNPALMDALEKDLLPFISVCYREEETGYSVIGLLEEFDKLPKYLAHGSLGKVISEGLINKVETPAE